MKADGPAFSGVLPKPKKSLKAFRYYIEVTDKALGTHRTAEYTTNVVASAAACQGKVAAGSLGSASVLLQVPADAAVVPVGFSSTGVVATGSAAAGSAAGAAGAAASGGAVGSGAAAAGAAASGGGGGLSTGALVGIVAGAGAVAAGVAVAVTRGGTTYAGSFNTEMVMTYFGCSHVHALSGTVEIALEESGGSATGPMEISLTGDTVVGLPALTRAHTVRQLTRPSGPSGGG